MKSSVVVRIEVEGFHQYKDAPQEVGFLKALHRHTFIITAGYKVVDLDREKEIFILRAQLNNFMQLRYGMSSDIDYGLMFGGMSCEMIAVEILNWAKQYGMTWVEVWEEQTGGGRAEI